MRRSPSETPAAGAARTPAAELRRAQALQQQGAADEAERIYRRLLRAHPGEPGVSSLLGLLLFRAGRLEEALAVLDMAIARHGKVAELHSSRGLMLARLGRGAEAEAAYRAAIAHRPDLADAHNNLAVALLQRGRTDEALQASERALQLRPAYPEALNNRGNALRRAGRMREAVDAYDRALALRPAFLEARSGRAAALAELGQVEAAIEDCRALHAAQPEEPRHALRLADLLLESEAYDAARDLYERALALAPASPDGRLGLARIAAIHGDFAAAAAHYTAALAADPGCVAALCGLADLQGGEVETAIAGRLEAAVQQPDAPARERSRAHYALSRVRAAQGRHAEAFAHLEQANALEREALRRRGHVFDAAGNAALVDRLIAAFDRDSFARAAGWGDPSALPLFIVGMPRSGTTLVEQILASHPLVRAGGERREIVRLVQQLPALTGGRPYPECIADLSRAQAAELARAHLSRLDALAAGAARFTDKQPLNFRHLGLIALLLPGARVIHCRRDPVDTCFSCYWQAFEAPMPWSTDLEDLAEFHRQYARLMAHWRGVLPLPMLELDHEALVADLDGTVRRLLEFCALPWEPRCLTPHATIRPVATASSHQVRQAVSPRVGLWRPYAGALGPLLRGLGAEGGDRPPAD